mmetsp:Transcript_22238/g.49494  ORF Transcript_22238/g.49494 Transcript_22238/m.49494 type:complete len:269 (-) Transcript_22238:596-1402(-)
MPARFSSDSAEWKARKLRGQDWAASSLCLPVLSKDERASEGRGTTRLSRDASARVFPRSDRRRTSCALKAGGMCDLIPPIPPASCATWPFTKSSSQRVSPRFTSTASSNRCCQLASMSRSMKLRSRARPLSLTVRGCRNAWKTHLRAAREMQPRLGACERVRLVPAPLSSGCSFLGILTTAGGVGEPSCAALRSPFPSPPSPPSPLASAVLGSLSSPSPHGVVIRKGSVHLVAFSVSATPKPRRPVTKPPCAGSKEIEALRPSKRAPA